MRKISSKLVAAVAVGAVAVTGTGVAYAYWTTTGSGSGTAVTSSGVEDALSFTGSSTQAMFPGDSAQTINGTVTNDATEKVYVSSVKAYLAVVPAAPLTDCDATDYLLNGTPGIDSEAGAAATTFTPIELAATNAGSTDQAGFSYTLQFNNKNENQDGCKGAAVTVHYLAS